MITRVLYCSSCQGSDIVGPGTTSEDQAALPLPCVSTWPLAHVSAGLY